MQQPPQKKPSKLGTAFRAVGKYLQQQARDQSYSALYLSSPRQQPLGRSQHLEGDPARRPYTSQLSTPYRSFPARLSDDPTCHSSPSMSIDDVAECGLFQTMKRHQYASDNILQSYDVLVPSRAPPTGYFLVFVHGGYFRDPKTTSTCFKPAITSLESRAETSSRTTGYASINYRLSPHPAYPQDPSSTPKYTLNNALWPDQPDDILAALKHLQSTYPQAQRYILSGHSVGAALSFVSTLRCQEAGVVALPRAIVGLSGIYDFPLIHRTDPDYESMTRNAMDAAQYVEASPALAGLDAYRTKWRSPEDQPNGKHKRTVVLAHSRDDGLVRWDQVEAMHAVFGNGNGKGGGGDDDDDAIEAELVEVTGGHDQVLSNGALARALERAIEMVDRVPA